MFWNLEFKYPFVRVNVQSAHEFKMFASQILQCLRTLPSHIMMHKQMDVNIHPRICRRLYPPYCHKQHPLICGVCSNIFMIVVVYLVLVWSHNKCCLRHCPLLFSTLEYINVIFIFQHKTSQAKKYEYHQLDVHLVYRNVSEQMTNTRQMPFL